MCTSNKRVHIDCYLFVCHFRFFFFVYKVLSDFEKVTIDDPMCVCVRACVRECVCVSVCVLLASDSSEIKVIITKQGTVTASDMIMHYVLIILT